MSEQDDHIDELFEKAKTAPPAVSLSEVKDLLKEPAVRKHKYSRRWVYFSLSCFMALVLFTWYKYSNEKGRAKRLPHFAFNTPVQPSTEKKEQVSVKHEKSSPVINTTEENIESTLGTELIHSINPGTPDLPAHSKKDSVKINKLDTLAYKGEKPARARVATETGIMIPWFADQEMLKAYHDKLAASGITLEIKDVQYVDNSAKLGKSKTKSSSISNKQFISSITANLYVNDVFYKTIRVNNFKEIRIVWETYTDGKVKIKSLLYLDENFMSRKL